MDNEKLIIENTSVSEDFYNEIRGIVQSAKSKVYAAVNTAMVEAYWLIGKGYALRSELNWTHYRSLIRIKDPQTRLWYMQEAITQNWSARALDRQIGVLYYERLLSSKEPILVQQEAKEKTDSQQLFASKYLPFLPPEEELRNELERERGLLSERE